MTERLITPVIVRFLNRAGVDIPGMRFAYAAQGADPVADRRAARGIAGEKLRPTGMRVFDSAEHAGEIKLWVE